MELPKERYMVRVKREANERRVKVAGYRAAGYTLDEIGQIFGISRARVCQIYKSAVKLGLA